MSHKNVNDISQMPTPLAQQSEVNSIYTFVSNSRVALKPGKRNAGTWNAGTENPKRRNRKPGMWNAGTENPEHRNGKHGTLEQKTRNAGTENPS